MSSVRMEMYDTNDEAMLAAVEEKQKVGLCQKLNNFNCVV